MKVSKNWSVLTLIAASSLLSGVVHAESISKDDFLLADFTIPEQTKVLEKRLPECKDTDNESVKWLRFVVKRYDLEVEGIAMIFQSAYNGNPQHDAKVNAINNFAELKDARDNGLIQANDFQVYGAPNLAAIINGHQGGHYQTDQKSIVMDVDEQSEGAKCVRKVLVKADSDTVGGGPEFTKKSQLLIFGGKRKDQMTD